jgi:hypothetical protein
MRALIERAARGDQDALRMLGLRVRRKRGRPENPEHALQVASLVWIAKAEGMGLNKAFVHVGDQMHLSPDGVREHWYNWKDSLESSADGNAIFFFDAKRKRRR